MPVVAAIASIRRRYVISHTEVSNHGYLEYVLSFPRRRESISFQTNWVQPARDDIFGYSEISWLLSIFGELVCFCWFFHICDHSWPAAFGSPVFWRNEPLPCPLENYRMNLTGSLAVAGSIKYLSHFWSAAIHWPSQMLLLQWQLIQCLYRKVTTRS